LRPPSTSAAVPDVTDLVRPALGSCPRVDEVVGGYTDGTRFFFADEQLTDIARAAGGGVLFRSSTGWRQLGATPQALPRHIIHGQLHHQLPDDWHWRPVSPQPARHGRRIAT